MEKIIVKTAGKIDVAWNNKTFQKWQITSAEGQLYFCALGKVKQGFVFVVGNEYNCEIEIKGKYNNIMKVEGAEPEQKSGGWWNKPDPKKQEAIQKMHNEKGIGMSIGNASSTAGNVICALIRIEKFEPVMGIKLNKANISVAIDELRDMIAKSNALAIATKMKEVA
jgi:hypothetical protein